MSNILLILLVLVMGLIIVGAYSFVSSAQKKQQLTAKRNEELNDELTKLKERVSKLGENHDKAKKQGQEQKDLRKKDKKRLDDLSKFVDTEEKKFKETQENMSRLQSEYDELKNAYKEAIKQAEDLKASSEKDRAEIEDKIKQGFVDSLDELENENKSLKKQVESFESSAEDQRQKNDAQVEKSKQKFEQDLERAQKNSKKFKNEAGRLERELVTMKRKHLDLDKLNKMLRTQMELMLDQVMVQSGKERSFFEEAEVTLGLKAKEPGDKIESATESKENIEASAESTETKLAETQAG